MPCHAETFLELFILPQFFQFSSSRNFQQKLPNRAKPGCQRLLNSCSRAKTGLALLLGPRGSLPLKKANASPDPPPSALKRRERGERPPPKHSRQTPRRDAQAAGEEHRRELTHLALERAHCLAEVEGSWSHAPTQRRGTVAPLEDFPFPCTRKARLTTGRGGMR